MNSNLWSGRKDSNLRPPAPKAGALPDCAMPRMQRMLSFLSLSVKQKIHFVAKKNNERIN